MKSSLLVATIAIVSFPLAAQTTGRIGGKILDSAGNPIAKVTVTLRRADTNVTRQIKVDKNGSYLQVGLEPYEFEFVVKAEGYVEHKEMISISIDRQLTKDITLKKPSEVAAAAGQVADPGIERGNEAADAYNRGIAFFNAKNYADALTALESALASFKVSIETVENPDIKTGLQKNIALTARMFALCQYEIGKADADTDAEKRKEMWALAKPVLQADFENNPDSYVAQALANIARMEGDKEAETRYLDAIDKIEGPQAESSFNRAVDLYNEGNFAAAKVHLKKAIEIDPKLSDTYYLLAVCEYFDQDMKAAKSLLEKYLQLDPKGKYADTVKEMLTDPDLK
ncbi:MAG: carboxypeptidase regulatory-like domain-containing protein [Holophagales bacterium]|jgi:tetratricopeptide (TPR) repeat protein|nr:carboxypeptidase regulatory-like domain-containing protein [Holophagales bacterium]